MELDHIFVFTDPESELVDHLTQAGLKKTFSREHPGQGTANHCFCFDNLYLECIYLKNRQEASSPAIRRTGLLERSAWSTNKVCPFGFAWRGNSPARADIAFWSYVPPYLPSGMEILVAEDGDDARQPMMFTFDGATAPSFWAEAQQNGLQHDAGFGKISSVHLTLPSDTPPSATLVALQSHGLLDLQQKADIYKLTLGISDRSGRETAQISLPLGEVVHWG